MNSNRIIEICSENVQSYKKIISGINYESKGIFNSEMLLFVSLTKYFSVNLIIESGRANGQSTKIIAECFKNPIYKIISVESNRFSPHVKNSYERLKKYRNLELLFGTSFSLIPELIMEECCILIDGPKTGAIKLAINCMKNPLVKAVFVHDLTKDSNQRITAKKVFNYYFFTDNKDYVTKFKVLDEKCWLDLKRYKKYRNWAPYRRDNKVTKSYFSTLAVFMNSNNAININQYNPKLEDKKKWKHSWSFKYLLNDWPLRIKNIIRYPFYFIFFEKKFGINNKINLILLLKN